MTDNQLNEVLKQLDAAAVNGWLNEAAGAKAICYLRAEVNRLRAERDELQARINRHPLTCYDCGRRYGDEFGFPDLVVPNDVWVKISPTCDEGGLLCPSCIVARCVGLGIECDAAWGSGPFVSQWNVSGTAASEEANDDER